MKRCHICGEPASIFLTQIADGKVKDLALCENCARERGIFDPRKLTLASEVFPSEISSEVESFIKRMLESSYMDDLGEDSLQNLPDMLTECPSCHYTLEDYQRTGMLGCPECYKVFASELNATMPTKGVSSHPTARMAVESEYWDSPALEKGRLEVLMQDAIREENYEEAARLRDRIKELSQS